jgi:hypothetical protein
VIITGVWWAVTPWLDGHLASMAPSAPRLMR